jgi:carbamoyltransferase
LTKILGIKYGGHDTSAAVMINGKIIAACAQERFSLDKHSRKFPIDAIKECLKIAKLKIKDLDEVAFVNDLKSYIREIYLKPAIKDDDRMKFLFQDLDRIKRSYNMEDIVREKLNFKGPINFYRHHLCHVASSYFPSGLNNALCLSLDGVGEFETGMFVHGKNGELKILSSENLYPHSLGLAYSAITYYLGWKHHCDEGIIMGLAPYGNSKSIVPGTKKSYLSIFREIIVEKSEFRYEVSSLYLDYYRQRDKWVSENFINIFGKKREYKNKITQHHKNIAAALQDRLEEIVLKQLKKAKNKFKLDNLCLAGGVALNCSMNGKIVKSNIFKKVFVTPASGDDGCAIGACFLAHKRNKKNLLPKKEYNFYKGSRFSSSIVKSIIKQKKAKFTKPKNINVTVAKFLSEGKIVAWFQDGAEFGPRALGNRSILCKPYPKEMKDYLNSRVKFREEFRPFAPAVLERHQRDFFNLEQASPHMLIACNVKKIKKEIIPAVVHIDDTCRVQTVNKKFNKKFNNLLEAYYKLTKIPVLLNTSFNIKGQPIVNTPQQAIDTFKDTNIDVLVIEDYILEKKNNVKN